MSRTNPSKYNPQKHHRRSIRLKGYDYSREGLYFITLCCQNRQHFFGTIKNGEVKLSKAGYIVQEEWERTPDKRPNTALHAYIIMPNHFHAIVEILFSKSSLEAKGSEPQFAPEKQSPSSAGNKSEFKSPSQTLGAIIRGFKGASTKRIKEYYFSNNNPPRTGESPFAPSGPGESPFAPSATGESKFRSAPGESPFAPSATGELPFAPTDKIWQRNYYEHIIRSERAYHRISEYIKRNPANWEKDNFNK